MQRPTLLSPMWLWFLVLGTPTALLAATFTYESPVEFTASGDFNGDGVPDFLIVDKELGLYRIGYGATDGTFTNTSALPTGIEMPAAVGVGKLSDSAVPPTSDRFAVTSPVANRIHVLAGASASYNPLQAVHFMGAGPDSLAVINIPGAGDTVHDDLFGTCRYETSGSPSKIRQVRHTGAHYSLLTSANATFRHRGANPVELTSTSGVTHVAVIAGDGTPAETLHLYRPNAAAAAAIANTALGATNHRFIHGRFGSETFATFLVYRPASRDIQAFAINDLGGGNYSFDAAVVTMLPQTVKGLYVAAESGPKRVLVIYDDGTAALWNVSSGNLTLHEALDLAGAPGMASGAIPIGPGKFQLLFSADGSGRSTDFWSFQHGADGWEKVNQGSLAPVVPYAAFGNVLLFDQRPFLDNNPHLLASLRAGDWSTAVNVLPGPPPTATATAEVFRGSTNGLGSPSVTSLGPIPAATAGQLPNQAQDHISVQSLKPAEGELLDDIQIDPPAGTYDDSILVTITAAAGTPLYFRTSPSASFVAYAAPFRLFRDATVECYAANATQRTPVRRAGYVFSQDPAEQDSDRDGVPDFVEANKGLDPSGGQDSDDDGVSDLVELIKGTNPNDAASKPPVADLDDTLAQLKLTVGPRPYNGATASLVDAQADVEIRAHTATGDLLGYAKVQGTPALARLTCAPVDRATRLLAVATPTHFRIAAGDQTGRELLGLVPVPDDVPEVSFTADPAKSWAVITGEWIAAAQTAYGSPPAVSVSLDPYDTLVLALMERRLTNVLRSRGAAVLAGGKFLNLTPQRTETNASFAYLNAGQLADLESVSFTGGDSLLLQEALATIETAVANASGDPDVAALRALVIDLYRMCSALNASDPVAFGPPIDVLRKFVNDPYHELPTAAPGPNLGYRVNTTLTLSELAAAGRAVNAIVAAVAARTTPEFLTLTYEEALDAASADTLARNPSTGIVYRLVDRFGAPFELPEAFTLATGTQFFVNAFTDLPARDGNATLEVIYLTITNIPAVAVQDSDSDLLPDSWERYFFGGTGANASSSDGSGYSALQEYFSGTDPRDAANNPSGPAATFQLSPVRIQKFAGSQLEIRWHWPTAYSSQVAFTIYESTDLNTWSATPYTGFYSGTPDTQRSIFPIPPTGPRYYVVGVRLR